MVNVVDYKYVLELLQIYKYIYIRRAFL